MHSQQNKSSIPIFYAETLHFDLEVVCNLLTLRFDDIAIKQPCQQLK
jgi:hypothetical protein